MKLLTLKIQNFRCLKGDRNIIDFSKSNILFLIGQNNVGKSTYLRAYEFFVNSKQSATREDFYNYDTDTPIIIEGTFRKEENDDANVDFQGTGRNADPEWVNKWVDAQNLIRIRKTWNGVGLFSKETFDPIQNQWVANGFGGMDSLFTKYAPTPIFINAMEDENSLEEKVNKLIQDKYLKQLKEQHRVSYQDIVDRIAQLQSEILGSDDIRTMNDDLNGQFHAIFPSLTLKIQSNKEENIKLEDAFKKNHTITVEKEGVERKESFLQNGHGIIRQALFNFIAFLQRNHTGDGRKEYLILFEEPELFLHPKITLKLRNSLYDLAEHSNYQILCATHSPMMIDISRPNASLIRAVKDKDENTITYQVDEDIFARDEERKERVQMINRFNPHVCEAFYADDVILVEGDTETIVYRDLLNRFYPNREIFVLNTGSKNNIPFFQEILTKFRIKHCVIHDVDTEFNADGHHNSAWTLNQRIWELVEQANQAQPGLSRRYVHNANFENAHKYHLLGGKEKPLQAYKFAQTIQNREGNIPDCLKWLDDYCGEQQIVHDMAYIENIKKDLAQIKAEESTYLTL